MLLKRLALPQDQPISYAQLDALIERAANALAARGIGHGDRVAIMLPNIPQFAVAMAAVLRAGYTCVKVKVGVGDDAGRLAAVRAA